MREGRDERPQREPLQPQNQSRVGSQRAECACGGGRSSPAHERVHSLPAQWQRAARAAHQVQRGGIIFVGLNMSRV